MKRLTIKKADTLMVYKKYIYICENEKMVRISIKEFKELINNQYIKERI